MPTAQNPKRYYFIPHSLCNAAKHRKCWSLSISEKFIKYVWMGAQVSI